MGIISLNLSPFKYSTILTDNDSPVQKINFLKIINSNITYYEVYSWLKDSLKSHTVEKSQIYGSCDATGTDKYLQIATWKSYSELIERWAYHSCLINNRHMYGLNIDNSTSGFAALPCWPHRAARIKALSEAIERWAISNWWIGNIGASDFIAELSPYKTILLGIPSKYGHVVINYGHYNDGTRSSYYYGFAHSFNLTKAIDNAIIEMNRNERVLKNMSIEKPSSISDQRLIYFSTETGHQHFRSRINTLGKTIHLPNLITDTQINGPWNRYATVWRCLFPNTVYNWDDPTHFMF